jgi:hypothetical protein
MRGVAKFGTARFEKPSYAREGVVYFALTEEHGLKVGFALVGECRPLALRLREIRSDYRLRRLPVLLGSVRGTRRLERELHEWFSPWALSPDLPEWFRPEPDLLSFVAALTHAHDDACIPHAAQPLHRENDPAFRTERPLAQGA